MPTLYEMKENLTTIGQQLEKTTEELGQKAVDPSTSMEDIKALQEKEKTLQSRYDIVFEQHKQMEAEQREKLESKQQNFGSLSQEEKQVKAKAEFIRASIQNRPMSDDVKQIYALPTGNETGGDNFLPTNLQKELVHEPFAKNQLRSVANVTNIKGLELPKISY